MVLFWHYIGIYMLSGFEIPFPQLLERTQGELRALTAIVLAAENSGINIGTFGVAIFFLITGFVTMASLNRDNHWYFLLKRVIRIWPVYIAGTVLLYITSRLYTGWSRTAMPGGIRDFIIQASLVRDWLWIRSVDGVGWTLEVQIKMYLVLFLLSKAKLLNRRNIIIWLSGLGALFVVVAQPYLSQLVSVNVRMYATVYTICFSIVFIIFSFVGVAFCQMAQGQWSVQEGVVTGIACMIAFYFAANSMISAQVTSYLAAIVLFAMAYTVRETIQVGKVMCFISTISFSVYIVHALNGYYLLSILDRLGANPYLSLVLTSCVSFLAAYILYRFVEKPCGAAAAKIKGKVVKSK